ncbi:hypothetical protein HDU76_008794 [Blyttiomyces sp. JEL0837]|nr:hypothetical protein HDU76_008794 [Blyttiomyces sp. JEL0837]
MPNSAVPLSPSSISLLKSFSSAPVSPVQTSIKSTRSSSPPPPPKIRDKPPAVPPIPVLPLGGFGAKSLLSDFSSPSSTSASTPKSQNGSSGSGTTSSSPSASIPTRSSSIRSILHNSPAKEGSSPVSRSITPPVNITAANNNNTTLELSLSPTLSFTSSMTKSYTDLFTQQSTSTIKNENIPLPYMAADPVSSVGLEDLIPFMSFDHPVTTKGETAGKPVPPPRGGVVNAKMSVGSFGRGPPVVLSHGKVGKGGGGGEGQVVEGGPRI